MKNLALGVLFAGLVAACGGGKKVNLIDAPPADAGVCNPLTQAGCADGEKCSWIIDDAAADIGHIGCSANGTVAIGGACMNAGGVGPDDCAADLTNHTGAVCVAGECKTVCDPMAAAAASGCDAQHACSRYSGLFEQGGTISYGACDPACDPLSQKLLAGSGNLEACGATTATAPNKGCYTFDFEVFTCAPVGAQTLTLTDRQAPRTDSAGNPFVNGCAPGYMPFFFEKTGSMKTLCTGLCAPVKTDIGTPGKVSGDTLALGKLPADATAVAGHAVCKPNIKGSVVTGNNQNCLFLWGFIANMDGTPGPSQYNDTLGVCFDYNQFTYDATGNTPDAGQNYPNPGSATQPIPSCDKLAAKGTLTVKNTDESFINGDASEWLCYNSVDSAFAKDGKKAPPRINPAMKDFRLGYGAGVAYRPTLVTK